MLAKRQLRSLTDLQPGDHLCSFYESEEERRAVLRSFISQGLERGEKILYIHESPDDENILKDLAELGVGVDGCLEKGCLSLVTEAETYLQDGIFDPERMIGMLQVETERALAQGYPALRAVGGTGWVHRGRPGSERLIEYEANLSTFFSKDKCLALCPYDLRKFDPNLLLNVLASHPIVITGTEIYENIYYIPPKELLSDNFLDAALRYFLDNLKAQRQAEAKSREEGERFQALFDGVPVPTYVWQRKGEDFILVTFNRAAQDYSHGRANELLGKALSKLYGDRPEVMADFSRCFREKTTIRRKFGQTSTLTRQWRDFIIHYVPVAPDLVLVHTEDVTERKRAEHALRQQAQIIDQIHDAVVSTDLDGYVTSWNKGAERIFGYSPEEAFGKHISFVYPEEQLDFLQQKVIAPLKEKGDHQLEVLMRKKDGQDFDGHLSLSLLRDLSGNPIGMIGYTMDISALKRTERELRARARMQAVEAELGQLALVGGDLQALMDQIVTKMAETLEVEYCKVMELLPGGEELLLKSGVGWKEGYVGEALVAAKTNSQAGYTLLSNRPVVVNDLRTETRFASPPLLSEHGVVSGMSVIILGKERPYGILGAHTTMQREFSGEEVDFLASLAHILANALQRKQAEEYLAYQANLLDTVHDAIFAMDENLVLTSWNKGAEQLYGWKAQEVLGRSAVEVTRTDFSEGQLVELGQCLEESGYISYELTQQHKDGHTIYVEGNSIALRDEGAAITGYVTVNRDITERTKAERALRHHAERLKTLREIDRSILAAESLENIARAALRRLGELIPYKRASVVLFNHDYRESILAAIHTYDEDGLLPGTEVPIEIFGDLEKLRAGEVFEVEDLNVTSLPIRALQLLQTRGYGSYICLPLITKDELFGTLNMGFEQLGPLPPDMIQIAREVADSMALAIQQTRLMNRVREGSERLRELSRQVVAAQEKERRRVSRELHDQASQALMALKISLELARKDLPEELGFLHQSVEEAVELADETMERIRLLAHDLRPPELDAVGLDPVLEDYCREFGRRTHLSIDYQGTRLLGLPDEISICFYRVLQEALTNILKHAHARHVQVELGCAAGTITLSVVDDGQGFDLRADQSSPEGSGIGLLGMRERVELLGGRLEVESHSGEGTRLKVTVPWEKCA